MATTVLANLIDPEVMAKMIDYKLVDAMKFAPLATIDNTLVGRPGDTITLPKFGYIGDAATLAEGATLTPTAMSKSTTTATIHKIAKGVELTDEALLSGYGDPYGEAVKQITLSIASQLDNEMLSVLNAITGTMLYTASGSALAVTDVNAALEKFGEDIDMDRKALVVDPALYTKLRTTTGWLPASEIAADRLIKGAVGEAYGCQVMISNKLATPGTAYIVMPGALRIFMKRDTQLETDRDILAFKNVITASKHEVCYLYDTTRAIKLAHA